MRWVEIFDLARGLLNDQVGATYDNETLLPYANIARSELKQAFALNNIPVTNETSGVINVPQGITEVGFQTPLPARLPSDLLSIRQLWWSPENQDQFIPSTPVTFLTGQAIGPNILVSGFEVWSWQEQKIKFLAANVPLDIKLNYIRDIFRLLLNSNLNSFNEILMTDNFFFFRIASLCYDFIEEDETKAMKLQGFADNALQQDLGIEVKASQPIFVRRRPFRAGWKARRVIV